MIRGAANLAGAVAAGVANTVGSVAGAAAGAAAGAVKGAFNGARAGANTANVTQNLLNAANAQRDMINSLSGKPQTNTNSHIGRNAKLPGMSGMAGLADTALHAGNQGVGETQGAMKQTMEQMRQVMEMQMWAQKETSIGQMVKTAFEGVTKEIKKSGEGIKNSAG